MKHILSAIAFGSLLLNTVAGQEIPVAGKLVQGNCTSSCQGTLGENIYPNGDFGSGLPNILLPDPSLAPGYIYQSDPPPDDGYYCIANSTAPWGSFGALYWVDIEDNGPEPTGYMMVVNASYAPGMFFQNTVAVCENTVYEFSVDIINLFQSQFSGTILPNLTFLIDSIPYCSTGDIPLDESWHTERFSFTTAPGQTSVSLAMRNNAPGGFGNDIAIDNISFRACGPELLAPDTVRYCAGEPAQLEVHWADAPFASPYFQWQIFSNGAWENIPGADSIALGVSNPQNGARYRLLAASALSNLAEQHCRVVTQEIRLLELPAVQAQITGVDVGCFGQASGSAQVQATAGLPPFSCLWSNGDSTATVAGLFAGNYTVTITDAEGCRTTDSLVIQQPPPLETNTAATAVSCFGGQDASATCIVSGGTPPYQFLWNPGQTTAQISGLAAGIYTVTTTDARGCSHSQTVEITEPSALSLNSLTTDNPCFGNQQGEAVIEATGGQTPYTFAWSNGGHTEQISGLPAGSYTVTVTDVQGCSASLSVTVQEAPLLAVGLAAVNPSCHGGSDGSVSAAPAGGTGPYSLTWSNGQTGNAIGGLPAGVFSVLVTDAHGCTATTATTLTGPALLLGDVQTQAVSCFGLADGQVVITANGGTMPYACLWQNGQTGNTLNQIPAGVYSASITDAHGCSISLSATVSQPPLLTGQPEVLPVDCFGAATGSAKAVADGGTPPYSYVWENGQTGNILNQIPAGVYSASITDAHGCSVSISATVSQPPALTGQIEAQSADCFGAATGSAEAVAAGGTPPYAYLWQNGAKTGQNNGLLSGWYQVQITDAHHCMAANEVWVDQPSALHVHTASTPVSCPEVSDGRASALATGGVSPYQFVWNNQLTTPVMHQLSPGQYSVTVTDGNGCTIMAQQEVGIAATPTVDLGLDSVISLGEEIRLTAHTSLPPDQIQDYTWAGDGGDMQCADCRQFSFIPLKDGCERVEVRTIQGCVASDEVCYQVRADRHLYAPNVFLPNGNGEDDYFTLFSDSSVKEIRSLQIYDRWGEQVFQTTHIPTNSESLGWDGTFRGSPLNPGVFAWVAEVEFIDGQLVLLKGDVTLLR